MTNKLFNIIVDEVVKAIKGTLQNKSKEYASKTDRLNNFKHAGIKMRCPAERALWGMYAKHAVSMDDIVHNIAAGDIKTISQELVVEKIIDSINYHILLLALLYDNSRIQEGAPEAKTN